MKNSKVLPWCICVVVSVLSIYALLITSVEIAAYGSFDFYQKEYEKYGVAEKLNMEMEDIMYVTTEMMDYLRGDRDTLVIETTVNGETREFFNESEISHMEDVRVLFIGGLNSRRGCVIIAAILLILLINFFPNWRKVFARAFCYTAIGLGGMIGVLGVLFATNFEKCFTIFHKIFFEGDTWLFDPNTSLMINMLPEGLFYDFTARIVIIFLSAMILLFVVARIIDKKSN